MNKKALMTLEELVKIILAAIIILGVFIPLGAKIHGLVTQQPDKESINTLDNIAKEISFLGSDEITIPVSLKETFGLISYNEVEKPRLCTKSCICLLSKKDGEYDLGKPPKKCRDLDVRFEPSGIFYDGSGSVESLSITRRDKAVSFE